jgi:hypothetical protein
MPWVRGCRASTSVKYEFSLDRRLLANVDDQALVVGEPVNAR